MSSWEAIYRSHILIYNAINNPGRTWWVASLRWSVKPLAERASSHVPHAGSLVPLANKVHLATYRPQMTRRTLKLRRANSLPALRLRVTMSNLRLHRCCR